MQDGLRDVITAAAAGGARQADLPSAAGRVTPLRAVDPPAATTPPSLPFLPDADHLGRGGLRLAFWLCGLQEALLERQRQGGRLTPREESLLALSRQDFISLRPTVTGMALAHLDAIVNDADLLTAPEMPPVAAELFALDTVRSLAARGAQTLREFGCRRRARVVWRRRHRAGPLGRVPTGFFSRARADRDAAALGAGRVQDAQPISGCARRRDWQDLTCRASAVGRPHRRAQGRTRAFERRACTVRRCNATKSKIAT